MPSRNPVRRVARVCAVALGLLAAILPATPARAATIVVTIPHDTGATNDGECSLREAIMSADYNLHKFEGMGNECASGSGNDVIELPTDTYLLTIGDFFVDPEPVPGTGDLDIFEEIMLEPGPGSEADVVLTINGNGSTVDASGLEHCCGIPAPDRVFHVHGVSAVINDLTIQGGGGVFDITGDGEGPNIVTQGGGIKVEADPPPGPHVGEGGELVLNHSVVRGNVAREGGGIYNDGGHVSLRGGTVIGGADETDANIALESGGGVYTVGEDASSTLVVNASSVEGNAARGDGGGIYNEFDTVEILGESTVSSNTAGLLPGDELASGGDGGGIWSRTRTLVEGEEPQTLYSNDFSGTIGSEWSGAGSPAIVTAPFGERYLGSSADGGQPLSAETVTLSLTGLPTHSRISVSFSFYAIRSWDGSECGGGDCAPDTFDFNATEAASDPQDATTFSNVSTCQAYPGTLANDDCFEAGTGSSQMGEALGYGQCCGETPDSTYDIRYLFEHTASSLDLSWIVGAQENWDNEGWGLDDVVVRIPGASGLFVDRSQVDGNRALECEACEVPGTGYGGGIYNVGHAEITGRSVIGPGNEAGEEGGGIWTGIEEEEEGGGLTLLLEESTVEDNTAGTDGGGIYNLLDRVVVDRSTISGNVAGFGDGGGIWSQTGDTGDGSVELTATNSTISGNSALEPAPDGSGMGGGIYNGGGPVVLDSVTLHRNDADVAGGNLANLVVGGGTTALHNTIVTGGTLNDSGEQFGAAATLQNCSVGGGSFVSNGFNLTDESAPDSCQLDSASDIHGANPGLGPLQHNGGPTETHALGGSSPAIDTGASGDACPATDQRGIGRPQGDGCDRGAFEREVRRSGSGQQPPPSPPAPPAAQCDIVGTAGADVLIGTDANEDLCGLQGDDTIRGGGGNDNLFGNEGDDKLDGGLGDDMLVGGPGTDTGQYSGAPGSVDASLARGTAIGEGASTDRLFELENLIGSRFPDILTGDDGPNVLKGKNGNDRIVGLGGSDIIRGARGRDVLAGSAQGDILRGGKGKDRLRGGPGADFAAGGQKDDVVKGNQWRDELRGGGGDDRLNGHAGKDSCKGGWGNNTIKNCEE